MPPASNRPRDCSTMTRLGIARGLSALGRAALLKVEKRGACCSRMTQIGVRWRPARELPMERVETSERAKSRDTVGAAVTRSSSVEWPRNAGACVTPFISQSDFA